MKKIAKILILLSLVITLGSCGLISQGDDEPSFDETVTLRLTELYNQGVESGAIVDQTFEEWLDYIEGPQGEPGKEVSFQIAEGYVQWQYSGDETWTNLIELSALMGPTGTDGIQGESAYDIYLKNFPEYMGTETEWLEDLVNGNLADIQEWTVIYHYNDGVTAPTSVTTDNLSKLQMPENPIREGYSFLGWALEEEYWSFAGYIVTENMGLTAQWLSHDEMPPVFSGQRNYTYIIGISDEPDYLTGITVSDNYDGDMTESFTIDLSTVDLSIPGVYVVVYSAVDEAGNEGVAQIVVDVQLETEPPSISGVRTLEVYQGGVVNYVLGLTVSDNVSDMSVYDIVVNNSAVDLSTLGRYPVIFTLTDDAGNITTEETEIVVVLNPLYAVPDANATYRLSIDNIEDLNPHGQTYDAIDLYGWVTDSLYTVDYDWAAAKTILEADGVMGLPLEIGFDEWYAAGYHAVDLPYNHFPSMADAIPVDVNGDGLVWEITLRDDLEFEDGTVIDANTFEYSWSMLLDPKLVNYQADYLYESSYLPLVNAEAYATQYTTEPPGDLVLWSDVGFEVINQYTFRISLSEVKTVFEVTGALMSGITGVVHEASYEAGMNVGRTSTSYGTIDNPLVSYGPFNMTAWEEGILYFFTLNSNHYSSGDFRITKIRYDVIEDESIIVDEFNAGNLDVFDATRDSYDEFKYSLNLKVSPVTTFFRFAFNVEGSDAYVINPILTQSDFRKAFYFAIDRDTFTSEVRDPSVPTFGFLGPVYYSTEYNLNTYRNSISGIDTLVDWSPNSFGYDPVRAKTLFDQAYAAAVAAGDIQDGEMVSLEYKFYDVEENWQVAMWVEDTVEAIFNSGESSPKFDFKIVGVSSSALSDAWYTGDFEMTFGGWTGLDFNAPSMLGQVYNSNKNYMLEKGFDTANAVVTATLPYTKVALQNWINDFEADYTDFLALYTPFNSISDPDQATIDAYNAAVAALDPAVVPTDADLIEYQDWQTVLALFVNDDLTCTFDELYEYAYGEFYNINDVNYEGKDAEFDEITATLETELLDQMIAIPLFSSVRTTVYNARIIFEADTHHARMAWGGLKYIYIGTEAAE